MSEEKKSTTVISDNPEDNKKSLVNQALPIRKEERIKKEGKFWEDCEGSTSITSR